MVSPPDFLVLSVDPLYHLTNVRLRNLLELQKRPEQLYYARHLVVVHFHRVIRHELVLVALKFAQSLHHLRSQVHFPEPFEQVLEDLGFTGESVCVPSHSN